MNKYLTYAISGVTGALIGASVSWIFAKKKYEKIADEEIESVKEVYNQKAKDLADMNANLKESYFVTPEQEGITFMNKEDIDNLEIKNIFDSSLTSAYVRTDEQNTKFNYMNVSTEMLEPEEDESEEVEDIELEEYPKISEPPVQISMEEYGDQEDFNLISLYYYVKDKVLVDDQDEVIEDPNSTVGLDNLKVFDEGMDDRLYVRNYQRHCDYEILLDERGYVESHI